MILNISRQQINRVDAEAKAKAIADQAKQAEAARLAQIQMAKMAKMAKEREIAKAEAAKVAAAEAVKRKMQIKQNYLEWCKDAKPNVWSVRFNSVTRNDIKYGVLVIGGNKEQAQKVAEDFIKKQFPVSNHGRVLKTFSDYDYPSDFSSFVIDKTNYYIRNEKSYEDLFDRSLIPTDITPPVA